MFEMGHALRAPFDLLAIAHLKIGEGAKSCYDNYTMKSAYMYGLLIVVVFGGLIAARQFSAPGGEVVSTKFDVFAECLSTAGATFYGAYWCPHCQSQKKLFENSTKLPYVECSTPNGQAQTPICTEAGITGYPTWIFADGSRADGEQTFEALSDKTGCVAPV